MNYEYTVNTKTQTESETDKGKKKNRLASDKSVCMHSKHMNCPFIAQS